MRFGRKKDDVSTSQEGEQPQQGSPDGLTETAGVPRSDGPYDISEIDLDPEDCVDLGSLVLRPDQDTELRLQVDEESGAVLAAVVVGEEAAMELRAFSASRNSEAWSEAVPALVAEAERLGGSAEQVHGPFGVELQCAVPVQTDDGQQAVQASRVFGIEGPRWLLRATLMGRPAVEPEHAGPWEEAIRRVVVRRGTDAMPPGVPLPLQLPPQAESAP